MDELEKSLNPFNICSVDRNAIEQISMSSRTSFDNSFDKEHHASIGSEIKDEGYKIPNLINLYSKTADCDQNGRLISIEEV